MAEMLKFNSIYKGMTKVGNLDRKYFAMCGLLNEEMEHKFIEFSNANYDYPWSIVLNTTGGEFYKTEMIAKIINAHVNTEVVVQGAYSAGMILLNSINCKIILSKSCRGMWHYGKWNLEYNDKGKPYYYDDECIIRNMPFHKKQSQKLAKKIMNAKELKDFEADRDVYFDFNRMKQIFPDAEIMK